MPTLTENDAPLQVSVKRVFEVTAVVVTLACTPSTGLMVVLKPLVPTTVQLAGGLDTLYLSVAVPPLRTRVGPEKVTIIGVGGAIHAEPFHTLPATVQEQVLPAAVTPLGTGF